MKEISPTGPINCMRQRIILPFWTRLKDGLGEAKSTGESTGTERDFSRFFVVLVVR